MALLNSINSYKVFPFKENIMPFKQVRDWKGYFVDENGTVIGKHGRPLKGHLDKDGYLRYQLQNRGDKFYTSAHRLVLKHFSKQKEQKHCNHLDGNKLNNHISNLEFCSPQENIKHNEKLGLINKGIKHGQHKLTEQEVNEIRNKYTGVRGQQIKLSNEYNISTKVIWNIIHNKNWRHL